MPSLQNVLAGIPGLGGYAAGQEEDRIAQQAQLQNTGMLQKLVAAARANQVAEQYRRQMAGAATDEERAAIAAQAAGPEGVLRHADTNARIKANQEQAAARLAQAASQWNAGMAMKMRGETRADALAALKAQDTTFKQGLARAAAQYNLPKEIVDQFMTTEPMAPAQATVASPSAPVATPREAPQVAPESVLRTTAPTEAAAMQQFATGGGAPRTVEIAPAAPQQAAAPPVSATPPMPPEIARASRKVQDAWTLRQTGIAGGGMLSPETLRMTAEQYLTGDRQAVQGYARSAPMRAALQNEIVKVAKEKGMNGADIAAKMSEFSGIMAGSRSVGVRAAQIELAASEANKMIDIVKDQSKKFASTEFVPWNRALKAFDTQTGAPEIRAYGAAINSLVNVYARAINPVGQPTINDKEHARELLQTIDSPAQVDAVLDILKQEMTAARSAPEEVRASLRNAIVGNARRRESDKNPATIRKYNPATGKLE